MKKLLSLLLAAAMVLTLAACGTTNADSNAADEPKNNAAADAADPAPTEETPESTGSKVLVAYSPIAHGEALKNPMIAEMAARYGVSAAQLCIRYVLGLGAVALPKTADPEHMKANAAVDFAITPDDMARLKQAAPIKDYGEFSFFPVFSGK